MDDVKDKLNAISEKLDIVLEEVYAQKTHRKSMEDLNADAMKIAESIYDIALKNLEEISEYTSIESFFYFMKKLARNIDNLTKLFGRLESLTDFWESLEPLTREIAISTQEYLDNVEKLGYFTFLKEIKTLMDGFVKNISSEDFKKFSQTILCAIEAIKLTSKEEIQPQSFIKVMKSLNNKDVKLSIQYLVSFLENFNNLKQNSIV